MIFKNSYPVLYRSHQVFFHIIKLICDMFAKTLELECIWVLGTHQLSYMLYFILHFPFKLSQTHYFGNMICLSMKLQMFSNTFRTQKFNALKAHMPDYFRRVSFAVVRRDGIGLSHCAGRGQEGSWIGVRMSKLWVAMKTGVLFV